MTLQKTILLTCCIAFANPALADDEGSDNKKEDRYDPTYSSIRLTSVTTDFDNIDRAINLGFTLGIHIPGVKFLSAEIDISSTLIPGENKGTGSTPVVQQADCDLVCQLGGGEGGGGGGGNSSSANNSNSSQDLRTNSVGIFAVGRTPGRFFGTARVGYRFLETSLSDLNDDQTGSALGAGLGYQYGEAGGLVELTYTQYGSDVQYISLAISY